MTAHLAKVFDTSQKMNLARALTQRASASPLIAATADFFASEAAMRDCS
jgi:hypothetical protein